MKTTETETEITRMADKTKSIQVTSHRHRHDLYHQF